MTDYEKNCLSELSGQDEKAFVFCDTNNYKLAEASEKIRQNAKAESFELLYDSVRREAKEIKVSGEKISIIFWWA